MTTNQPEYFGSEAQQAVLRRGRMMHDVTRDDQRFTYYGRIVGLTGPEAGPIEFLASLTRLQGASHYASVPVETFDALHEAAIAAGLSPTNYARWIGGESAIAAADRLLRDTPLPDGLRVARIDADTPADQMESFARAALDCGVMPAARAVMTGQLRRGVALAAIDAAGQVVSTASAAAIFHPDHPEGGVECWWGMLATREAWRGHRLSLILGAQAIQDMHRRHGFSRFFSGVVHGNAPSEAVCTRLGLAQSDRHRVLSVADAALMPGGQMTK